MKLGRNDPCPCGSGKKYKRCCMDNVSQQNAGLFDEIEQTLVMNPNLSMEDLNVLTQHKMLDRNNRPIADFCGLSPAQMANWLYEPMHNLVGVTISTPSDLSSSPVMRYLGLIVAEAMHNDGSFKATSKGNLPAKLVQQASALLPEFAVSQFRTHISINEFAGSNEDKFNALHYTRILAELAGIISRHDGKYHIEKAAQNQYQSQGIQGFFMPMLEASIYQYNWAYLDSWESEVDLRTFWLFMLWRLQSHSSVDQLLDEVVTAFPDLVRQIPPTTYSSSTELIGRMIESRFVERFLQFWGFVIMDPKRYNNGEHLPRNVQLQPLLTRTFQFNI